MVGYSADITGAAVSRILEIIRQVNPKIRYFQPCTSHMFGKPNSERQNEETPFNPQSPYACSKAYAFYLTKYYRQAFGIFASTAILYNHESPRRTPEYVTRKISRAVAAIALGKQQKLQLGDLSSKIDWGYAKEYMHAAWSMLQLDKPDDFVIATGEAHSIREFVDEAFGVVNLKPDEFVRIDQSLIRPTSNSTLIGDISKPKKAFGFDPKIKFKELVRLMVESDIELLRTTN